MTDRMEGWTMSEGNFNRASYDPALEHRIQEMHRLLDRIEPTTAAVALKTLRDAFPETSLAQRVKALSVRKH